MELHLTEENVDAAPAFPAP